MVGKDIDACSRQQISQLFDMAHGIFPAEVTQQYHEQKDDKMGLQRTETPTEILVSESLVQGQASNIR